MGPRRTHRGGCAAPRVTRGIPADTEAVVALAFACLEREQLVRSRLAAELRAAVRGIRARFVAAQSEDGFIGNIFSTPLAMQVGAGAGACASSGAWVPAGTCRVQVWVQVYGTTAAPCPRHCALSPSSLSSQVFIATDKCRAHTAYGRAMAVLLQHLDAFTSAAAMAQALPVLHGRSYLDIASMQCKEEPGRIRGQGGAKGAGTRLAPMPPWWLSLSQTR